MIQDGLPLGGIETCELSNDSDDRLRLDSLVVVICCSVDYGRYLPKPPMEGQPLEEFAQVSIIVSNGYWS